MALHLGFLSPVHPASLAPSVQSLFSPLDFSSVFSLFLAGLSLHRLLSALLSRSPPPSHSPLSSLFRAFFFLSDCPHPEPEGLPRRRCQVSPRQRLTLLLQCVYLRRLDVCGAPPSLRRRSQSFCHHLRSPVPCIASSLSVTGPTFFFLFGLVAACPCPRSQSLYLLWVGFKKSPLLSHVCRCLPSVCRALSTLSACSPPPALQLALFASGATSALPHLLRGLHLLSYTLR